MKKIYLIIIALLLIFTVLFAACKKNPDPETSTSTPVTNPTISDTEPAVTYNGENEAKNNRPEDGTAKAALTYSPTLGESGIPKVDW